MGKKSKYKKIRQIAANMPALGRVVMVGSLVKGSEAQTKEIDGEPVDPNKTYRQLTPTNQQLNHYRRMKEIYQKHGARGVQAYYDEVNHVVEVSRLRKQMEEANSKTE